MPLRLVFMGTPAFAAPTLRALVAAGHDLAAVYTRPPRPAGRRGLDLTETPVADVARELGLAIRTPRSLRDPDEQRLFRDLGADAAVVVAYGLILPQAILDATRRGAWNGHASALPRWRGAAPIQRAVMAGDAATAMAIMKMEAGLDTGPVALVETVGIPPLMTSGELHDRLAPLCATLMVRAMAKLADGSLAVTPQRDDGVLYAAKIDKAETRIDWSRPAAEVHNHLRGLSPAPGAWCEATLGGKPERLRCLRSEVRAGGGLAGAILDDRLTVACGEGAVGLLELQRAGGRLAPASEFLRGARLDPATGWPKTRAMPRYRLDIEYDGRPYAGWQRQAGIATVQQAIERALAQVSGEAPTLQGAGRTDAGVHALGQVAHVDLARDWPDGKLADAVNAHLKLAGDSVAILGSSRVADDFSARFSALRRHYVYRILNRGAPPAVDAGRVWHVGKRLDAEAMHEAAQRLVGRHDFTTFRSAQCQANSPIRTLDGLDVRRAGNEISIRATARSFLHNQVRSMVGTLKRVGDGAIDADGVTAALEARSRAACGQVAPPDGLFLLGVDYPDDA